MFQFLDFMNICVRIQKSTLNINIAVKTLTIIHHQFNYIIINKLLVVNNYIPYLKNKYNFSEILFIIYEYVISETFWRKPLFPIIDLGFWNLSEIVIRLPDSHKITHCISFKH